MTYIDGQIGGNRFTRVDHDDLHEAARLVVQVMDRHTLDIILPALSALCQAVQDMHIAERYMGGEPTA